MRGALPSGFGVEALAGHWLQHNYLRKAAIATNRMNFLQVRGAFWLGRLIELERPAHAGLGASFPELRALGAGKQRAAR